MNEHAQRGAVVTGLPCPDPVAKDLHTPWNTCAGRLNAWQEWQLSPGVVALAKINRILPVKR